VRKAWHREKELLKNSVSGTVEWTPAEAEEIVETGVAKAYEGEYMHDVQQYPELAEDPFNVRFVKKTERKGRRKRSDGQSNPWTAPSSGSSSSSSSRPCSPHWWLPWRQDTVC
jgi:teneurin